MKKKTQDAHFRQRMMLYAEHHGVEETAIWYHVHRKTVWKWKKRWDGTVASLEERSRRPQRFPKAQEPWEIKLVASCQPFDQLGHAKDARHHPDQEGNEHQKRLNR